MSLPIDIVVPTRDVDDVVANLSLWDETVYMVEDDICKGNANVKRNYGAKLGKQPYIFFCDEDITLMPGILMKMLGMLLANPSKAYCYCDFIVWDHPCPPYNWVHRAKEFNAESLRAENYISTMSLIKREAFEAVGGFDPTIERLQDWDLWLKMLKAGLEGVYLPEIGFTATYGPNGITRAEGYKEAAEIVRRKHGL